MAPRRMRALGAAWEGPRGSLATEGATIATGPGRRAGPSGKMEAPETLRPPGMAGPAAGLACAVAGDGWLRLWLAVVLAEPGAFSGPSRERGGRRGRQGGGFRGFGQADAAAGSLSRRGLRWKRTRREQRPLRTGMLTRKGLFKVVLELHFVQ